LKPASKAIKKDKANKARKQVKLDHKFKQIFQFFGQEDHPIFKDFNQASPSLEIVEAPTHEHSEKGCCSPKSHSGCSGHEHHHEPAEKPQELIKTTKK
jgi:hypothetical protein